MGSLSEGTLDGDVIECPWHGGAFYVRTGQPASAPCTDPLRVYAVTIEDGFRLRRSAGAGAAACPRPSHEDEGRKPSMSLEQLTARVRQAVGDDFGALMRRSSSTSATTASSISTASSTPNTVSNEDKDSKITIMVSRENFERIIDHKLNPKLALMTGQMRLKGDIRIAMRLDKVFGTG